MSSWMSAGEYEAHRVMENVKLIAPATKEATEAGFLVRQVQLTDTGVVRFKVSLRLYGPQFDIFVTPSGRWSAELDCTRQSRSSVGGLRDAIVAEVKRTAAAL